AGSVGSVQQALYYAQGNPGPDRVLIGHGDFVVPDGGLVYDSPNRVEIRGISPTETRLLQANQTTDVEDALKVSDSASGEPVVADLQVVIGEPPSLSLQMNVGLHMGLNSRVENVALRVAPGAMDVTGIDLDGQTSLSRIDLDLGYGFNRTWAVRLRSGAVVT